jgi:hypothetical protein
VRAPGSEQETERPTLTVSQVFELAERVSVRPVGNIRKLDTREYRLRYRAKDGDAALPQRTSPPAKRPNGHYGSWLRTGMRTLSEPIGYGRSSCSPRSRACDG